MDQRAALIHLLRRRGQFALDRAPGQRARIIAASLGMGVVVWARNRCWAPAFAGRWRSASARLTASSPPGSPSRALALLSGGAGGADQDRAVGPRAT